METKLRALLVKLISENAYRAEALNDGRCSEYGNTVLTHKYNNTLDIIKQLEEILK